MKNIITFFLFLVFVSSTLLSQTFQKQKMELMVNVGHTDAINSAYYSHDGRFVVSGGYDTQAILWDATEAKIIDRIDLKCTNIQAVFNKDDSELYIVDCNNVLVYSIARKKIIDSLTKHELGIESINYNDKSNILITGSSDRSVIVWDLSSRTYEVFFDHDESVMSVTSNFNGDIIATGDKSGKIVIRSLLQNKTINLIEAHDDFVMDLKFINEKDMLVSASFNGEIKYWNYNTGKEIYYIKKHKDAVKSLLYLPDKNLILSAGSDKIVYFWDMKANLLDSLITDNKRDISTIDFTFENNNLLISSWDKTIRCYNIKSKQNKLIYGNKSLNTIQSSIGKYLIISSFEDKTVQVWNSLTYVPLFNYKSNVDLYDDVYVDISSNDSIIVFNNDKKELIIYDVYNEKLLKKVSFSERITSVKICATLGFVATGHINGSVSIINLKNYKVKNVTKHQYSVRSLAFNDQDELLAAGGNDGLISLYDLQTMEFLTYFKGYNDVVSSLIFLPSKKLLISGGWDGYLILSNNSLLVWNYLNFELVDTLKGHKLSVTSLAKDEDDNFIFSSSWDNNIIKWDIDSKKSISVLNNNRLFPHSIFLDFKGTKLFSYSEDSEISVWSIKNNIKLIKIIIIDSLNYIHTTPDGRFDYSSEDALDKLHYVAGLTPITFEQMNKERFYVPGLFKKVMAGEDRSELEQRQGLDSIWLFPDVTIDSIDHDFRFSVNLENRGGGFGNVEIWVNDKAVFKDIIARRMYGEKKMYANGIEKNYYYVNQHSGINDTTIRNLRIEFPVPEDYFIKGKENYVTVRAWDTENTFRSRDVSCRFIPNGKLPDSLEVKVFVVSIGVSNYTDDYEEKIKQMAQSKSEDGIFVDLPYADKDAKDIAKAFRIGAENIFLPENVHTYVLTTDSDSLMPIRSNIMAVLDTVKAQARAHDILIIYYSGHGTTFEDDFYYIPKGIKKKLGYLDDPGMRERLAVSDDEMNEKIREIPCNKCALILDACESGRVTDDADTYGKDISEDRKKTIALIREGSGMVVLAGSAANASSYMASRYDQSLLTYGLLAGLKGGGLGSGGEIKMRPLFDFAVDFVKKIAEKNNLKQTPQTVGHNDIMVGRIEEDDYKLIPFEQVRPIISEVNLVYIKDNENFGDRQDISGKLENALYKTQFDRKNEVIYINSKRFPDTYHITGDYKIQDGKMTLSFRIAFWRDMEIIDFKRIERTLNLEELDTIMSEISDKIFEETINLDNKIKEANNEN
jgi:WD40 repeat protein